MTRDRMAAVFLVIVAVIHLLPVTGLAGPERLSALYGIEIREHNLIILMQHRAVLFGMLGVFLLIAAWNGRYRRPVIFAALVSTSSFIMIAGAAGDYNAAIARVVVADIVATGCLLAALGLDRAGPGPSDPGASRGR